jgi:ATP-dependent Clp protease ATP-binding subunit ClpA
MSRLIHDKIKQPLASEILFGKLADGGSVLVDEQEGELVMKHSTAKQEAKKEEAEV